MKVLVLNSGSSSQKSNLYEVGDTIPEEPPDEWDGEMASSSVKGPDGTVSGDQRG